MAKPSCDYLIEITKLIREETLIEHNDFSNLSGLEDTLRQTDYILSKINSWISRDELYENQDAEIFLGSLRNKFKELIVAMKYLDEN